MNISLKLAITILYSILLIICNQITARGSATQVSTELKAEKNKPKQTGLINIIEKPLKTTKDIEPITSKFVKPVRYTNVLSLASLSVVKKKKKFIELVLPGILIAKFENKKKREKVIALSNKKERSKEEQAYLDEMLKSYKAKSLDDLKKRLLTHPTSIILAQASIECGWGTSRFFLEGRNIFGVWSFDSSKPRIKTKGTRNGKHIYVKKYATISEAINDYLKTLARGGPYARFRETRAKTKDPYTIIKTLDKYSELGEEYIAKMNKQIRYNELTKYDDYQIDPKFIVVN